MPSLSWQFQDYLNSKAEFTAEEVNEARWRRVAYLAFAFVIFAVGVPVWWVTTAPHRTQLPLLESTIFEELENRLQLFRSNGTEVWDSLELHTDYNLHFIFVHNGLRPDEISASQIIERKIYEFSRIYLQPIGVEVRISSEHLWDFSLANFLLNFGPNVYSPTIDSVGRVPAALATELDRLNSPPAGPDPLLKIAIFFNNESVQIHHNGQPTDGLAIASWGGIILHRGSDEALLNTAMAILHLQLSIPPVKDEDEHGFSMALERHQERLAIRNMLQTGQILNSLHELAFKIEDLVISDDVAAYAAQSSVQFHKAYSQMVQNRHIDSESAAQARRLAELANGHHSLLELLNFPSDQKYGIYVPLFLPLLVPLFQPLAMFMLFLANRYKEERKSKMPGDEGERKKTE